MSRLSTHLETWIDEQLARLDPFITEDDDGVMPLDIEAALMAEGVFVNPLQDYTE